MRERERESHFAHNYLYTMGKINMQMTAKEEQSVFLSILSAIASETPQGFCL